ncbi:MAG: hypothetical protein WC485_00155 [Opitutaceae bacterium]
MMAKRKTAAYWEGWLAAQTRQPCKYSEDQAEDTDDRDQWADGFAAAVKEGKAGKVWWKSKTIQVAGILAAVGVGMIVWGKFSGGSESGMMMGAGGGMTVSNLVSILLRTITDQPVYFGGSGSSNPPYLGNH